MRDIEHNIFYLGVGGHDGWYTLDINKDLVILFLITTFVIKYQLDHYLYITYYLLYAENIKI